MRAHNQPFINIICLLIIGLIGIGAKSVDEVTNYIGISTLTFEQQTYNLSWSSHPNATYYKQEYLPDGEVANNFHNMVLVDFINSADVSVQDAVTAQVKMLIERKKTDVVCNYQLLNNADKTEFILDFVRSESKGNELTVVEWSGYHYKAYTDKAGHKGVLLMGVSRRAYGQQTLEFLKALKEYRNGQLQALTKFATPEIQIK